MGEWKECQVSQGTRGTAVKYIRSIGRESRFRLCTLSSRYPTLYLDSHDLHEESSIVGQELLITLKLLLDPFNGAHVCYIHKVSQEARGLFQIKPTLDVISARVVETSFSIAVATEPLFIAVLLLAVMTSLDVFCEVVANTQGLVIYILI